MIVGINGQLTATGDDWVNLTVGGITLRISVPQSEILTMGPEGSQVQLYTHLRIRDEQPVMYGFTSQLALDLFLAIQSVSGVGPRLGLALLSGLGAQGLHQAIAMEDSARLSGVSGVGRRIAERIILELKGKVEEVEVAGEPSEASSTDRDLAEVLASMGFNAAEIRRTLANLERSPDLTFDDYLRRSLELIGGW